MFQYAAYIYLKTVKPNFSFRLVISDYLKLYVIKINIAAENLP